MVMIHDPWPTGLVWRSSQRKITCAKSPWTETSGRLLSVPPGRQGWCTRSKFQKMNINNNKIVSAFSDRLPLDANGLTFVWLYKRAARLLVCTGLALETVLCACKHTTLMTAQESTTPRQLLSSKHFPRLSRLTEHLSGSAHRVTKRFHLGASRLHRPIVAATQMGIRWSKYFQKRLLIQEGASLIGWFTEWLIARNSLLKNCGPKQF